MTTPYQILKAEAKRQQLPKSYKSDLTTHDQHTLRRRKEQPKKFVWLLRDCGTHLFYESSLYAAVTLQYFEKSKHRHYYIFQDGQLKKCTMQAAMNFLLFEICSPQERVKRKMVGLDYFLKMVNLGARRDVRLEIVSKINQHRRDGLYKHAEAYEEALNVFKLEPYSLRI
jgi:hypothetical protein